MDSEDFDVDFVVYSVKKLFKFIVGLMMKCKCCLDGCGRRVKAYKKIKKDKGVCVIDVYVMVNGKKMC